MNLVFFKVITVCFLECVITGMCLHLNHIHHMFFDQKLLSSTTFSRCSLDILVFITHYTLFTESRSNFNDDFGTNHSSSSSSSLSMALGAQLANHYNDLDFRDKQNKGGRYSGTISLCFHLALSLSLPTHDTYTQCKYLFLLIKACHLY